MSTPNFRNLLQLTLFFFLLTNFKNNLVLVKPVPAQKNISKTLNGRISDQTTGETSIGVSIPARDISAMLIRGSSPDQNQILLDDAPLYTMNDDAWCLFQS